MKSRYGKFNNKKEFLELTPEVLSYLQELSEKIDYLGNPAHKKNPGDFGLRPPSGARVGKSLCDKAKIFERREALELLKKGMRIGCVSKQQRNGFPQNVWAVIDREKPIPLEAQLENNVLGQYHGYPIPEEDPLHMEVLKKWESLNV